MMRWLIGLTAFLVMGSAYADQDQCPQKVWRHQGTVVQQGYFFTSESCFLSVRARETNGLEYRNFLFTSRGLMMVFNSFGDGPSSSTTGASEFLFFPLTHQLAVEFSEGLVVVTMANGSKVRFDADKAYPLDMEKADLLVDPVVRIGNEGGVSILKSDDVRMELGFQMGMSPSWYLNRQALVIDKNESVCRLTNKEIFVKKDDEIFHRYPTNDSLKKFLTKRCPDLSLW